MDFFLSGEANYTDPKDFVDEAEDTSVPTEKEEHKRLEEPSDVGSDDDTMASTLIAVYKNRERERARARERARDRVSVCVRGRERESARAQVRERERERAQVRERERQRDRERKREGEMPH